MGTFNEIVKLSLLPVASMPTAIVPVNAYPSFLNVLALVALTKLVTNYVRNKLRQWLVTELF